MARHPDQNYFGAARDFSDTEFAKFARSVSAHTPSRCLLESESIFAARDHDPLRPWYSVPGTPFRVHFGTAAGHGLDRVSRNGAHDSDVTRLVLTRFRGRPVNASTLVEIGDALIAWWRAEQADAMSRAVFEELVPKPAAQNAGLTLIAALEAGLSAIERLRAPAWEMALERVAEQARAGGVDCDVTRRAAYRRVRIEAAMADLVCEHVRLVHDPKLRWYGMAPKDLMAVAARQLKGAVTAGVLEPPPGIEIVRVVAKPLEHIEINVKFADAPGETP